MHFIFPAAAGRSSGLSFLAARLRIIPIALLWLIGFHTGFAAAQSNAQTLALTPPMGWNDWAHYQCGFNAETILDNATALVKTGLAARGYSTVTIDDCWMLKTRDAQGNLQPDPQRFPHGMKPLADAIHHLGLKFGIYEDSGSTTCGGYAGSGWPQGGGNALIICPGCASLRILGRGLSQARRLQCLRPRPARQSRCLPQGVRR